jgi:predicted DNA-binding transcriptional regulator AlpA
MNPTSSVFNRKLRAPEAAAYVGLSASTLAKMRLHGNGPEYSKAGPRIVIYDRARLDDWIASRARRSTAQDRAVSG